MNYYTEIETYIKKNEVSKKVRVLEENRSTLENYWNIGRLLVEAQGGSERAKYGKGYDATNLRKFGQFYLAFPKRAPMERISWTNIKVLLPIQEENRRNYYINRCLEKNLSRRELEKETKNNSYERLINKPKKIEIIVPQKSTTLLNQMKNPILIEIEKGKTIQNEQELETTILAKLQNFFNQLGEGFSLIDNQYKINFNHKNYYIDILLFNYKLNCFCVVELKLRELKKEDKAQVEFYMQLIDNQIKEPFHNKTIGIIISKQQDKLIANFVRNENVIPLTYEIKKEEI